MGLDVEINPSAVEEKYLSGLNRSFGQWGDRDAYRWDFEREVGARPADLMVLRDHGEILAGSAVSYRTVSLGDDRILIGIMTGLWTLPEARGCGASAEVIVESRRLVASRGGAVLIAFVTHENASRRRLVAAGCLEIPTWYGGVEPRDDGTRRGGGGRAEHGAGRPAVPRLQALAGPRRRRIRVLSVARGLGLAVHRPAAASRTSHRSWLPLSHRARPCLRQGPVDRWPGSIRGSGRSFGASRRNATAAVRFHDGGRACPGWDRSGHGRQAGEHHGSRPSRSTCAPVRPGGPADRLEAPGWRSRLTCRVMSGDLRLRASMRSTTIRERDAGRARQFARPALRPKTPARASAPSSREAPSQLVILRQSSDGLEESHGYPWRPGCRRRRWSLSRPSRRRRSRRLAGRPRPPRGPCSEGPRYPTPARRYRMRPRTGERPTRRTGARPHLRGRADVSRVRAIREADHLRPGRIQARVACSKLARGLED